MHGLEEGGMLLWKLPFMAPFEDWREADSEG